MQRRAFTAIEALLTIGIIAVTTGVTVPVYRNYQIRSELTDATEQLLTAMRAAQLRARAGETAGTWGVETSQGILFQGDSFELRNPQYDEHYPLPPTVVVSGLAEVIFLPLSGLPESDGEILLTAQNGDSRTIIIGELGMISTSGLIVPSLSGGGTGGEEGSDESSSAGGSSTSSTGSDASDSAGSAGSDTSQSSVTSGAQESSGTSSATSAGTSAGTSSAGTSSQGSSDTANPGGGNSSSSAGTQTSEGSAGSDSSTATTSSTGGGTRCEDRFNVGPDGSLQTTGRVNAQFTVLGSQITYGAGGPEVSVTVQVSTDGGRTYRSMFSGRDVDGGETETITGLAAGSRVVIKVTGKYSWMFNSTYVSTSGDGRIMALRDGDEVPSYRAFANQASLASFLRTLIDSDQRIQTGQYDAVYLAEIGASITSPSADFQDLVLHVQFTQEEGSCVSSASSSSTAGSDASSQNSSVSSAGSAAAGSSQQSSAVSSESGKKISVCHFSGNDAGITVVISESAWPSHAAHGDHKGECDKDDDGDGIKNAADFCPSTRVEQPKKYLLFFRNALTQNQSDIFRVGPTKKISTYTLSDTAGCSCEQLLDVAEGKPGYYFTATPSVYLTLRSLLDSYVTTARKYGCSADLLKFIQGHLDR